MWNWLTEKFIKSLSERGVWLDADQARKIHNICLLAKNSRSYSLTGEEQELVAKLGKRVKEMK
jgi:hypothetical protein